MVRITRLIDDRLKYYGEADVSNKVIRINKKLHKSNRVHRINPNKDGSESLISTIVHEELHVKFPKKTEKEIREMTKRKLKKMTRQEKKNLYAKYRK